MGLGWDSEAYGLTSQCLRLAMGGVSIQDQLGSLPLSENKTESGMQSCGPGQPGCVESGRHVLLLNSRVTDPQCGSGQSQPIDCKAEMLATLFFLTMLSLSSVPSIIVL